MDPPFSAGVSVVFEDGDGVIRVLNNIGNLVNSDNRGEEKGGFDGD